MQIKKMSSVLTTVAIASRLKGSEADDSTALARDCPDRTSEFTAIQLIGVASRSRL